MAEWSHYATPNAEWAEAVASVGGIPSILQGSDLPTSRALIEEATRKGLAVAGDESLKGLKVVERRIPVFQPQGEIPIRIYIPDSDDAEETFPIMFDLHGSAYCLGSLDTDEMKCRIACRKHRIVVVNVDYRLAPEFPWPTGIDDSYDALKWVITHASELRANLNKGFILSGLSAGGMFACVITQRARTDPVVKGKITGQLLQIPSTCLAGPNGFPERFKYRLLSMTQNANAPIINPAVLKIFLEAYKPGPETHIEVSPLLAESFSGLPPAYIQVAGADPLRDEGLCYAECLKAEGVPVKLDIYPGVPHGFVDYFPELKVSQKWKVDFDQGVQWLLQKHH